MTKKRWFLGCLVLMCLSACSHKAASQSGAILKLSLGAEPSILNPLLVTDSASMGVTGLVFSGLTRVNSDLKIEPDLADHYTLSPDGKVYTFYLKKNILWHDGVRFKADDVVFTLEKLLDPKTNTVHRSEMVIDGTPVRFKALDDFTLEATLPKPFAPFLLAMGMAIIPKHLLEHQNINTATFNQHPIGTGPFVFQKWESGQYVSLKRFEKYYQSRPKLDGILYKIIPNENTSLVAFEKGEIDSTGIPPKDVKRLSHSTAWRSFRYQELHYVYMGYNLKKPLFADVRVRQALACAVDKKALVSSVLKGFGAPAELPCSPVSWAYPKRITVEGYNPQKSIQLLQEVGYVLNHKTGLLEKEGHPFEFTLLTNKGNLDREKTAEILQQYFLKIGVKVNIQVMEWSSMLKIINGPENPKKFDAVILGWGLGLDPDAYSIWHSKEYPKGFNFIGYSNPEVDRLLEQGRSEVTQEARATVYYTLFMTIANDHPYLFLYYPDVNTAVRNTVKGLSKPGPTGLMNPIESVYKE